MNALRLPQPHYLRIKSMISRREFVLGASAAIGAVGAVRPLLSWGTGESPAIPGKHGMIARSLRFLDLEMPAEYANSFVTPVEHFYVRNHMHEPQHGGSRRVAAQCEWRSGEVADTDPWGAGENAAARR